MKAITICQPWAWAIGAGHKRVENRTWATSYRGPLAIHAGKSKKWLREGGEFIRQQGLELPTDLTFGAIIAVAELVDVVELGQARLAFEDGPNVAQDPWAFGPFCWLLHNVRPLPEPIACRGALGLFEVPEIER